MPLTQRINILLVIGKNKMFLLLMVNQQRKSEIIYGHRETENGNKLNIETKILSSYPK